MFKLGPYALFLRVVKPIATLFVKKLYSRVVIRGSVIEVRGGIVFRRRIYIRRSAIKCVCIEQGPISRIFNMFSLSATFRGESEEVDSKVLLLPLCKLHEAKAKANECFDCFLSQKGVFCFKGRRILRERRVYCRAEDIGSIRLSSFCLNSGCSLKLTLHSKHRNAVKVCGLPIERGMELIKKFYKNE